MIELEGFKSGLFNKDGKYYLNFCLLIYIFHNQLTQPNYVLFYKITAMIPLQSSPIAYQYAGTEAQVRVWVSDANEHGGYRETTPKTYNTHYYNVHSVTVHT